MYDGKGVFPETYYSGFPGAGPLILRREKHVYTCEHCGYRYKFDEQAYEEFYCKCGELVSVITCDERQRA